jgi:hypothetical protein
MFFLILLITLLQLAVPSPLLRRPGRAEFARGGVDGGCARHPGAADRYSIGRRVCLPDEVPSRPRYAARRKTGSHLFLRKYLPELKHFYRATSGLAGNPINRLVQRLDAQT